MSLPVLDTVGTAFSVPRASGDEPDAQGNFAKESECSPRERG